jgi:hypothetical protein
MLSSKLSPLAEKRILFLTIQKRLIGRRAYSDSVVKRGSASMLQMPQATPPTQQMIEEKVFMALGC